MNNQWYEKVRSALERSWSEKTSYSYHPKEQALSHGQCAQTAIVIFEKFGGEIIKTDGVPNISGLHFYNSIGGQRYDFTADQFNEPIPYKDIPSTLQEAASITWGPHLIALRYAFKCAWEQGDV